MAFIIGPPEGNIVISKKIMYNHTHEEIRCYARRSIIIDTFEEIDGMELAPVEKLDEEIIWAIRTRKNGALIIALMYTSEI